MAKLDLTLNGRLHVDPMVTDKAVLRISEMVDAGRRGGFDGERARLALKETLTTSDAPFSWTHIVNMRNLPLYDEVEPEWRVFTEDETLPDFTPQAFFAFRTDWSNLEHGKDNDGHQIAPLVAENDTYQYAFGYTQEDAVLQVLKRGFKTGFSLEKWVNQDLFRLLTRFPQDMLNVGVKTDAYVVYRALTQGVTAASQLIGGTAPITGATVPVNAPASADAVRQGLWEISQRTDADGNRIPLASRYYIIVGIGQGEALELDLELAKSLRTITVGDFEYAAPASFKGGVLSRVAGVLESEYLPDSDHWYAVPAAGTGVRPAVVRAQLAGYTAPEVYVSGFNGIPLLGGASSDPFRAFSFDADVIDLKFRQFTNAVLFSEDQIVWSEGTGVA